ncbi:hypothetical protein ACNI65_05925 [Roseateles sp. So40a]|uniref:hypothetical protein n=1 Tax=Roseateles sp. So40a TaxID=3400226 RepID=UPI003A8A3E67
MITSPRLPDTQLPGSGPWWRHPMMWLIVGGPSIVVVAGIATLMLAVAYPDPVVGSAAVANTDRAAPQPHAAEATGATQVPAMTARNHAATGGRSP